MDTIIAEVSRYVGDEVTLKGWLYNIRSSGKIHFLQIRDGTGRIQGVAVKGEIGEEYFNACEKLKMESSLIVSGIVREDTRAPSGYEMSLTKVQPLQIPEEDYPIAKQDHGEDFLLSHRHLWLRSHKQYHILRVRNEVIWAIREFFYKKNFILVDTPILTGAIGENAGNLFEIDYFDLGKAYLAQTGQLYNEAAAAAFRNVYCFGPTFRAEKSKTRRHLTEFWMVEAEMAFCSSDENMALQEELVRYILAQVLEKSADDLKEIKRDTAPLEEGLTDEPFPRVSYTEAVDILHQEGSLIQWGDDLGGGDETILSNRYKKPVFIYNYPKKAKPFYMEECPDNDLTVLCNDLFAPEGYGEIIGASERASDYEKLLKRIKEEDLPLESYQWYLDLRKYGTVQHAGFGMGIERTVTWICGISHVREAIPFPRMLKRLYP